MHSSKRLNERVNTIVNCNIKEPENSKIMLFITRADKVDEILSLEKGEEQRD